MGTHTNAAKGCASAQKGASPILSCHGSEADDTGDMVQDLMEEVTSFEEVLSEMCASSKMPFQFT